MELIEKIKNFNIDEADLTLWTFKKQKKKNSLPQFNGHWVDTTEDMDTELKNIVRQQLQAITETQEYSLLAQTNESSALTITEEETHAGLIKNELLADSPKKKTRDVKTLWNCSFYVIKLVDDNKVLYAVKKSDGTWRSTSAKSIVNAFFSDKKLNLANDESFRIQKTIDFFGYEGDLAVRHKSNFESVLHYKADHEKDYEQLSCDVKFIQIFDNLLPLSAFVKDNKIHLRRMSAIRQKGFYADPVFMDKLRAQYKEYDLNINFDSAGLIIPSEDTCRDIIIALLDHRLSSAFSENIYDVPNTIKV